MTESKTGKRVDITKEFVDPFSTPFGDNLIVSYVEDFVENKRYYSGDVDAYYAYERIIREVRLVSFTDEQTTEDETFEDGEVRYKVEYKNDDYIYSFDSLFMEKQNLYYKAKENEISLKLVSNNFSQSNRHQMLSYNPIEIQKADIDKNGILISRIATLQELREKYDLSWMKAKDYRWVNSLSELKQYMLEFYAYFKANPKTAKLAFDTETTGLNVYNLPKESGEKDVLVSIVITWKKDFALYIPLRHTYEENLDEQAVLKILYPFLKNVPIITQYGVFDLKTLIEFELEGENIPFRFNLREDLLIENYVIDPNPNRGSRGLKDQVAKWLNIKQLSLSDLFPRTADGKKQEIQFQLLRKEIALFYACPDVDLLLACHDIVRPQVPEISNGIYNVEIQFMPIAAEAEYYGLKIDMKQFYYEKKLCEELAIFLEHCIYEAAGYKFNINSHDQVSDLLYNKFRCEKIVRSKSNPSKGSTNSKALKHLSKLKKETPDERFKTDLVQYFTNEKGKKDQRIIIEKDKLNSARYPIVLLIMQYRDVMKLLTGFFDSIERSNKGGRLYSWVNQTGAQTGRIISPLQTLPPYIKKMIIPDTSEHGWIVMDFKQVELRLMFGIANETSMIEESQDPDKDIHRIIAAGLYHKKIWQIFKALRGIAKALNFGIPYQLGIPSLAEALYGFAKTEEQKKENIEKAKADRAGYMALMPRVERMFEDTKLLVSKYGKIFTRLGRGYYYPSIFEETDRGKIARMLRQGGNARIQGLGADTFKYGAVELDKAIRAKKWHHLVEVTNEETGEYEGKYPLVRQSFFVHDELGVNYHKKTINPLQVLYLLQKHMEVEIEGFPPLYIGPAVVVNWAEAKKDKFEIPTQLLYKWCEEVEQGMHTEPLENPEKWVLDEVEKYHALRYEEYFKELRTTLSEQGLAFTVDNIKQAFRHDNLVHHVMSIYDDKMYEKENGHQPEDVQWLEWAVAKYIKVNGIEVEEDGSEYTESASSEIELTNNPYANIFEEMETGSTMFSLGHEEDDEMLRELEEEHDIFSAPVDVVDRFGFVDSYADAEIELSEDYYKYSENRFDVDEYLTKQEQVKQGFSDNVMTMARVKYIDVSSNTKEAVAQITEYLKEQHRDDGLYGVSFLHGQEIIETPFMVDKIDEALIDLIINKTKAMFVK